MDERTGTGDSIKRLRLRFDGTCCRCGTHLGAGTPAVYDRDTKTVSCIECPGAPVEATAAPLVEPTYVPRRSLPEESIAEPERLTVEVVESPTPEPAAIVASYVDGAAGSGALREFERRHNAREQRIREGNPKTATLRLALTDDPESTRAWATGAVGEIRLGETLDSMAGPVLRVLHDRKPPRTRANIDHIVICPSGVFVVDSKRYRGQRPQLRAGTLYVGSRNQTRMLDGMHKQLNAVRSALGGAMTFAAEEGGPLEPPVHGVLCFIDADFPLIGGDFTVQGVEVLWPRRLYAKLAEPGPLDEVAIGRIFDQLRTALPAYEQPVAPDVPDSRLTEPPRRKLLPLLIRPLLSLALLGLLAWAFASGLATDLARIFGEWFSSILIPGR